MAVVVKPIRKPKGRKPRATTKARYTLVVDPGLSNLGVALFRGDRLIAADALYARDGGDGLYQIRAMASAVVAWWRAHKPSSARSADLCVVIEKMTARAEESSKLAVTNSLIALAHVAGAIAGQIDASEYVHIAPGSWSGMRPKYVNHDRMNKRLDETEAAIVQAAYGRCDRPEHIDVADAVCIGLFIHKRL
jgi:hypothetical protein